MALDICCIARREEMTIIDWVEYHRRIGINHIYIFDNNDIDDFQLDLLLKYYLENGYVTIIRKFKGQKAKQMQCYDEFINSDIHKNWTAFIDCDEYFVLDQRYKDFNELFTEIENKCPNIGVLYVNWICYTSSGNVFYEPKPVVERFKERLENTNKNNHIKSIVKGGTFARFISPHNAMTMDGSKIYDMNLNICKCSPFQQFTEGQALYLNHYVTKSIQEYIYRKYGNGTADKIGDSYYDFDYFLKHNNKNSDYYYKNFNEVLELYNNGKH